MNKITQLITSFLGTLPSNIHIQQLSGGSSAAIMAKVIINDDCFVVRIFDQADDPKKCSREILAQQLAADHDLAPMVYYYSPDYSGMIMACVQGKTLKLTQTKEPTTITALATAIGTLHRIKADFLPTQDIVEAIEQKYQNFKDALGKKEFKLLDEAINIVWQLEKISKRTKNYVFSHGDLNPTNIFLYNEKIILIDWSDAKLCEPFFDVAVATMLNALDKEQTQLLLNEYLQQIPTEQQQAEFNFMRQAVHLDFTLNLLHSLTINNGLHIFAEKPSDRSLNMLLYEEETLFTNKLREIPVEFTYAMATSALNEIKQSNS